MDFQHNDHNEHTYQQTLLFHLHYRIRSHLFRLQCDRRAKVGTQCVALLNVTIPGFLGDSSCSILEPGTYPSPQLASSSLSLKTSSKS